MMLRRRTKQRFYTVRYDGLGEHFAKALLALSLKILCVEYIYQAWGLTIRAVRTVENDLAADHISPPFTAGCNCIHAHLRTSPRGIDIVRKNNEGRIDVCGFILFARPRHVIGYKILKLLHHISLQRTVNSKLSEIHCFDISENFKFELYACDC